MIKEKTICAQATAPGDAGIAIIRISGQDALKILKKEIGRASCRERV